jgi:RHS repeat-associated protein
MTVAGQTTVNYTHDDADRLTQITQGSSTVTIAYDDIGRRTSLTLPNGISTEYQYDLASHLTSLTYKLGGNVLGNLTYDYDAAGRRTNIAGTLARSITPQAIGSASYNAANQQLTVGTQTLTYDLNGNLTSDRTNTYTWDARDRLISISGPGVSATFQYDAVGRRSSKNINGLTTSFLYDGVNIVQEQSAQLGNANLLNGGIDEFFSRSDSSGTWSPLVDGLGSSLALTDSSGATQAEYTYSAFGASANTGASTNNSSQYTGRENDSTGLQYSRARYYSPTLQRFISEDPLGLAGGGNLYAYVGNSPMNFSDPSGLQDGPINYMRDPFSADHWILNGGSNTISDILILDRFAGWGWVAGDWCRPPRERLWAGGKIIGAGALLAGGGPIARGAGRLIGAGGSLLGAGGGALIDAGGEAAAGSGGAAAGDAAGAVPKLLGTARDNLLEAATDPGLRDAINNLYRPGATIGDGSSMDALRAEGSHLTKVLTRRTQLMRIRDGAALNSTDRQLARELLINIQEALSTHFGKP